jgi:hypothetical protein
LKSNTYGKPTRGAAPVVNSDEAALELGRRGARRDLAEEVAAEHLAAVEPRQPRLGEVVAEDGADGVQADHAERQLVEGRVVVAIEVGQVDVGVAQPQRRWLGQHPALDAGALAAVTAAVAAAAAEARRR